MKPNTKHVYIMKYALTKGVLHGKAEIVSGSADTTPYAATRERGYASLTREYVLTELQARLEFERRRLAKIDSLKKQIKKLEGMTCVFKPIGGQS